MAHFVKSIRNIVIIAVLAGAAFTAYTKYTDSGISSNMVSDTIKSAGDYAEDYIKEKLLTDGSPDYTPEADTMFNDSYDILSGDIAKCAIGSDGMNTDPNINPNIDIDIAGCTFKAVTSDDGELYIEAVDIEKYQCYTENDTVFIKGSSADSGTKSKITLYIPKELVFSSADIELGAGSIEIESIKADELKLECGAGMISADYAEADGITLKCSAGSIKVRLFGVKEDYDYIIENAIGMVDIDGESYNGVAQSQRIQNGADKEVSVSCSLGSIKIEF